MNRFLLVMCAVFGIFNCGASVSEIDACRATFAALSTMASEGSLPMAQPDDVRHALEVTTALYELLRTMADGGDAVAAQCLRDIARQYGGLERQVPSWTRLEAERFSGACFARSAHACQRYSEVTLVGRSAMTIHASLGRAIVPWVFAKPQLMNRVRHLMRTEWLQVLLLVGIGCTTWAALSWFNRAQPVRHESLKVVAIAQNQMLDDKDITILQGCGFQAPLQ